MATLTGMDKQGRAIESAIKKALNGRVKKFIMADLNQRLNAQQQPDGSKFPKKAESTKRAYRAKGWNTEKFLVATGESARLQAKVDSYGGVIQLMVTPIGHEILSYNVPKRVRWFPAVTQGMSDVVMNILNEEIRNGLR